MAQINRVTPILTVVVAFGAIVAGYRWHMIAHDLRACEGRSNLHEAKAMVLKRQYQGARTDRHHRGIELSQCQSMSESLWVDLLTCRETPVVKLPGKL